MKLRKPYQHSLSEHEFQNLFAGLKVCETKTLQCYLVARKPVTYGWKIQVFLLGYRPGLCGDNASSEGITKIEWDALTEHIRAIIKGYVPSAQINIEQWHTNKKFQFTWETYIQTREP